MSKITNYFINALGIATKITISLTQFNKAYSSYNESAEEINKKKKQKKKNKKAKLKNFDGIKYEIKENQTVVVKGLSNDGYHNENIKLLGEITKGTQKFTVTKIGKYAFQDKYNLKEVFIGEGILEIKKSAFEGCRNLSKVCLPRTLKSIDLNAFYDCPNLKKVYIPDNVTHISSKSFEVDNKICLFGRTNYLKQFAKENNYYYEVIKKDNKIDMYKVEIIKGYIL